MSLLVKLCLPFLLVSFLLQLNRCNQPGKENAAAGTPEESVTDIKLPPGFSITVFAKVPGARSMTLSPSGVLYIGTRNHKVYAVTDDNKDGFGDQVYTIASGLNSPNGVAFKDGSLYIATISSILRIDDIEKNLAAPKSPVTVYDQYPSDKHHGWKFIAFGPDGKLYVPVGAPCNVCERNNPVYASITRINPDGSGMEVFAKGVRNTVGFAWHPVTGELWFTDNGRDLMGDEIPHDELNHAPQKNMHFGFPYCHQGNIPDPEYGKGNPCADYTPPVQLLGPHVAALGMRFSTAKMFGREYANNIFIAQHGSWNRSDPIGYRVVTVGLDENGRSLGMKVFAEGWLGKNGKVTGRPVDVEWLPDGSLLVSDDYSGKIYRIFK